MTPDGDQRLLCRVLGARAVPQDAVGDRVQADLRRGRQAGRRRHDRPAAPGSPADAPRSCLNAVPGWVRSTLYESQGASVNRKSDSAGLDWRPHVASSQAAVDEHRIEDCFELGQVARRCVRHMRRVDEERAPIHIDEVHDVDLAGGMVRVGAAGDVPLGPGSELALVARRNVRDPLKSTVRSAAPAVRQE